MREIQNLTMIALYIINLASGNYFPSLYGISLYVSFKSQGTLNVNNSLKKNPHGLGLSWKNKIVIF